MDKKWKDAAKLVSDCIVDGEDDTIIIADRNGLHPDYEAPNDDDGYPDPALHQFICMVSALCDAIKNDDIRVFTGD